MVAPDRNVGCFGRMETSSLTTCQGLLQYQSKDAQWKARWFLLDAVKSALVKCNLNNHLPANSHGSVLGGNVFIADARPLSEVHPAQSKENCLDGVDAHSVVGFKVLTHSGTRIIFRTKTLKEQDTWLTAIHKSASGFAVGIAARLAERELLAGKFTLVRELGRGASGIVSLYTWQGKPYAIKKFVPQKSRGLPNRRAVPVASSSRLSAQMSELNEIPYDVRREMVLLKKVSNLPYVIRLHDVILDKENREYYLVMEYMGGGAIAEWDGSRKCYVSSRAMSVASGSACLLDEDTVRTYVTNLVIAIQGLHLNNLAHRDIKPENLMANEEHTLCKLGDLGVARYFKEENGELRDEEDVDAIELGDLDQGAMSAQPLPGATLSKTDGNMKHLRGLIKSTKGTFHFLPPESLTGEAYCAFKADIWAIGVTLYALLFGSLPFYSSDTSELFDKIEKDPLAFPAHCKDNDAKDLLIEILEKDPEKRITLDGILQHRWTHRNIDSKNLLNQLSALKQSPAFSVEDHELGDAVSVHQMQPLNNLAIDADAFSSVDEIYKPLPIDISKTICPGWFEPIRELVTAQMHYDWCHDKAAKGWKYGNVRDDANLVHPSMLPMRALDEIAQARKFSSVDELIKCVVVLGVVVVYRRPLKLKTRSVPFPLTHVHLSWKLMMLVDLLAENSHGVWANEYTANGWRFGVQFDDVAKTHPSLKPYMLLDENEKTFMRNSVTSVLKSCIYLGCKFSISHCDRKRLQV